jgi:hypothetical protein
MKRMDEAPALHPIAIEVDLRSQQVKTPPDHAAVNRPAAVAEERRGVERGLRDNRLRIDRKPRLPLCLQDVAALEILAADRQLRLRPSELARGGGRRVDEPLLERPAERLPVGAKLRRPALCLVGKQTKRVAVRRRTKPEARHYRGCDHGCLLVVSDLPERRARAGALDQQRVPLAVDLEQPYRTLAAPVHKCIGLVGALFLRKVELQHGLTAVRERRGRGQRDVPLPEGLAEPE